MLDQELEVKFAEKVLGWTQRLDVPGLPGTDPVMMWIDTDRQLKVAVADFKPCTDLNQAWLGYILLRQREYGCYVIAEPNDAFEARIYEPKPPYHVVIAQDNDHPARAMVKACLEVVGEESTQ